MRKMDAVLGLVLSMMTVGCGATPSPVVSEADTAGTPSGLEVRSVLVANGCAALEGIEATFVLYLPDSGELRVCDSARASQQFLPASTFKVANALIALETGAVTDPYAKEAWDGVERAVPAWNQDTSLATGMANSTVWLYQRVAQRIGAQRMRERVRALQYGNADIGPDADIAHFWLDGALRISAIEQVTFLDRLSRRALPVSERSQSLVAQIMTIDGNCGSTHSPNHRPSWTLRAKTGAVLQTDPESGELVVGLAPSDDESHGAEAVGWLVGWLENDETVTGVFAFNMRLTSMDQLPMREALTRQLLVDNGLQVPLTRGGYECAE